MCSKLEVADIFRRHGDTFRAAQGNRLSLDQRKVMAAIEACRTSALGGHVERCEDCGEIRVAYNSCRGYDPYAEIQELAAERSDRTDHVEEARPVHAGKEGCAFDRMGDYQAERFDKEVAEIAFGQFPGGAMSESSFRTIATLRSSQLDRSVSLLSASL